MKRLIAYFVTGMRTGSFFYLGLVLLAQIFPSIIYPTLNSRNILAIFLMSGTMGILSVMIEELEFLAYSIRVVLHLLVTAVIFVLTCLFFGWGVALLRPVNWLIFLLIYGLIWLYQIWETYKQTQKINQALKDKRKHVASLES